MLHVERLPHRNLPAPALAVPGAMLGLLSFSGHWQTLALAGLLTVFIQLTRSRGQTFFLCLGYYLAASRGLPDGIGMFMGDGRLPAVGLWILANTMNASIHAIFWARGSVPRALLSTVAVLLLALPPFGITGWASPLVASGVLFPRLGIFGLIQFLVLVLALNLRYLKLAAVLGAFSIGANLGLSEPPLSTWSGHGTAFGQPPRDDGADFKRQISLGGSVEQSQDSRILLPETTALQWNPSMKNLWSTMGPKSKTIALGTVTAAGERRQAVVFLSHDHEAEYHQRQPVPLTMWKPWPSSDGYAGGWFENPVLAFEGQKLGVFICYESFLVWPVVHSALSGAEQFLLSSNLWWSKDTSIPGIQSSIMHAWARLFHIPYAVAVNL